MGTGWRSPTASPCSASSVTLIIVFDASVNALVSLYAIGVFTGFTLAGAGMVARHLRERTGKWASGSS